MPKHTALRPAIAMIELIFALVVMGIVFTSAPLLISQAAKSNTVALQQESIAMIAAHTNALMTHAWDEANNIPTQRTTLIDTNGSGDLNRSAAPQFRDANLTFPNARQRRFSATLSLLSSASDIGRESGENSEDDIDDFDGTNIGLIAQSTASNQAYEGEYIDVNITIATTVNYGVDTVTYGRFITFSNPFTVSSTGSSNIKLITSTLTTTATAEELQKQIIMRAFMSNIGGATPLTRGGY